MKKLLVFLTLITTSLLHASEYILYQEDIKDNKSVMLPLDEKEHAAAYQVLTKYQFPMSLCHDLEKELSPQELALLDTDEEKFLQSKMPASIKVAFIPKVLYELLFLKLYLDDVIKIGKDPLLLSYENYLRFNTNRHTVSAADYRAYFTALFAQKAKDNLLGLVYCGSTYADLALTTKKNGLDGEKAYYKSAYSLIAEDFTRNFHNQLNTRILAYLDPRYILDIKNNITKITLQITHALQQCSYDTRATANLKRYYDISKHIDLFHMVAALEIETHKKNSWLIYRGTDPISATLIESTLQTKGLITSDRRSISYGNSFFGSIIRDYYNGGTVPYFHVANRSMGYACSLDKADYRKRGLSHALIFIPPFNTLIAWGLFGECTHPRTKLYMLATDPTDETDRWGYYGGIHGPAELPLEYLCTDKERFKTNAEFEAAFQEFLAKNMRIIKDERKAVASTATTTTTAPTATAVGNPIKSKL